MNGIVKSLNPSNISNICGQFTFCTDSWDYINLGHSPKFKKKNCIYFKELIPSFAYKFIAFK